MIANARALLRVMRQGGYDAVHVHLGEKSVVALWCARRCGIGVRVAHAHIAHTPERWPQRLLRLCLRGATSRIATARMACGEAAARFVWGARAVDRGEVYLCRNAIALGACAYSEALRQSTRQALGLFPTDTVIGHVGRLCAQKNQLRLLDIFVQVLRRCPDARLLLVGEGEDREALQEKIARLGIADRVCLTGVQEDVGAMLCAMDVMVFPSTHEGLPFALLEAQCCGLPVLCSDAVTREVALTPAFAFCSLAEADEQWAARALSMIASERRSQCDALRAAGYDIDEQAAQLSRFYAEQPRVAKEK